MTDAGAPGEFAQRKVEALRLAQDFQCRLDDRTAQVAVVVGTFVVLGLGHRSRIAVVSGNLDPKVGDVNILHASHLRNDRAANVDIANFYD